LLEPSRIGPQQRTTTQLASTPLYDGPVFATLLGGLPRPPLSVVDRQIELAIRAQEEAGLEPVTDGRLRDPAFAALAGQVTGVGSVRARAVDGWRFAAALTDRAVKQALPGPYSLGWRPLEPPDAGRDDRAARTLRYAEALNAEVRALAAVGCPMVEIEETDAHLIGEDEGERRLFREAHRRLTDGVTGTHLSLSIVGGSAAGAGVETILAAPYASLAVDLIAGPDNWNLVTRAPGDRGVIVGVLSADETIDEPKEIQLWASRYAASTGGRGLARVGLGSAGGYENLTWEVAVRKMQRLGDAARLAELPPGDELARAVDPRSLSSRQAALGSAAAGRGHGHAHGPGAPGPRAPKRPGR
jgi:Methionine synthase II (cobalamin-independent)